MKIFICGLSGAGKDTIANYLRDIHNYLKLRIAGTIKMWIQETYGFNSFEELETNKRLLKHIRKAHNNVGALYDRYGTELCGSEASNNRVKLLAECNSIDFDTVNEKMHENVVISDVRTAQEALTLLNNGWIGLFLTRKPQEYRDVKHKTEQILLDDKKFVSSLYEHSGRVYVIDNTGTEESFRDPLEKIPVVVTNGTSDDLIMSVRQILAI